jgi:methylated-DNA-[protein]-cysteine S-methyltransferase
MMDGQIIMESPLGRLCIREEQDCISTIQFLKDTDIEPIEMDSPLAHKAAEQLEEYFSGKRTSFDFHFRQQGTNFQQRVWNELMKIPYGNTISYLELARRLGDEKTIRAAASSNGKNNLAIVVPCHRVIGSSGKLVGYAGGLWRKKWLLEHEQSISGGVRQPSLFA